MSTIGEPEKFEHGVVASVPELSGGGGPGGVASLGSMPEGPGVKPGRASGVEGARALVPAELAAFLRETLGKHPAKFDVAGLVAKRKDWVPPSVAKDAAALSAFLAAHTPTECYADRDLTLRFYLKLGALLFVTGYRYAPDDHAAALGYTLTALYYMEDYYFRGEAKAWALVESRVMLLDSWVGGWFTVGCPRVQLRREEASALALTDMPDLFVDEEASPVRAPWPHFLISLPAGTLRIKDGDEVLEVDRIMMHRLDLDGVVTWFTLVGCGADVFCAPNIGRALTEDVRRDDRARLAEGVSRETLFSRTRGKDRGPIGDEALRGLQAATRIAAGVCFAMENKQADGKLKVGRPGLPSRVGGIPKTSDYRLGLDVVVDFTEALADFTLGRKAVARKSQWVVRGHWRNQAVGKRGAGARRRTWVKPFWKGPVHLPVLVRTHVLPESKP